MVTLLKQPLNSNTLYHSNCLVEENLDRVYRLARRYANSLPYEEREDVFAAATLGLVEASKRYSYNMETSFWTFAQNRVLGAIKDDLRRKDPLTRSQRRKVKLVTRAYLKYTQVNGEEPTDPQLCESCGMSFKEVHEAKHLNRVVKFISFEEHERRDDGSSNARICHDKSCEPETAAALFECMDLLKEMVCELPQRERQVVQHLYYDGMCPKDVASQMGVSEGRISQLNKQAIIRLRKKARHL